jgi:hypothetical protein
LMEQSAGQSSRDAPLTGRALFMQLARQRPKPLFERATASNNGSLQPLAPAAASESAPAPVPTHVLPVSKPSAATLGRQALSTDSELAADISYLSVDTSAPNMPSYNSRYCYSCDDESVSESEDSDDETLADFFPAGDRAEAGGALTRTDTMNTSSTTTTKRDDNSIRERINVQSMSDLQYMFCSKKSNPDFCPNQGKCLDSISITQLVNTRLEFLAKVEETTNDRKDKYEKYLRGAFRDPQDNFHFELSLLYRRSDNNGTSTSKDPVRVCEAIFLQITGITPPFGLMKKDPGRAHAPRAWQEKRKDVIDGVTPVMRALQDEIAAASRDKKAN